MFVLHFYHHFIGKLSSTMTMKSYNGDIMFQIITFSLQTVTAGSVQHSIFYCLKNCFTTLRALGILLCFCHCGEKIGRPNDFTECAVTSVTVNVGVNVARGGLYRAPH